jgi:hypothetical protein
LSLSGFLLAVEKTFSRGTENHDGCLFLLVDAELPSDAETSGKKVASECRSPESHAE